MMELVGRGHSTVELNGAWKEIRPFGRLQLIYGRLLVLECIICLDLATVSTSFNCVVECAFRGGRGGLYTPSNQFKCTWHMCRKVEEDGPIAFA